MFLCVNSTNHEFMIISKLDKIRENISSKGIINIITHTTSLLYYSRQGAQKSVSREAVSIWGKTVFIGCARAIVTRNSEQL